MDGLESEVCSWINKGGNDRGCVKVGKSPSCSFYEKEEDCNNDINGSLCAWIDNKGGSCVTAGMSLWCSFYYSEKICESLNSCSWINNNMSEGQCVGLGEQLLCDLY
jgi:hypothetical protein